MAQEFCQANGAQLRYEATARGDRDAAGDAVDELLPAGASTARYSGAFVIDPIAREEPRLRPPTAAGHPASPATATRGAAGARSRTWPQPKQTA
jgi:hypothetical protein